MKLPKPVIPTALTILGMFFGFASVTQTLHGHFVLAAWLLAPAGFLDLFDGMVAKTLRATSAFGAEIDSFSDIIAFGLAPAVLIYSLYFARWGVAGVLFSFLPLLFGSLRLTRFNLHREAAPSDHFTGLPIPCVAGILAGFVILTNGATGNSHTAAVVAGLTVLVSGLMVSTIPFASNAVLAPRRILRSWLGYFWLMFFPALVIVPRAAFFLWTSGVIALGLIRWGYGHVAHPARHASSSNASTSS
jgi:CDP-diacylglycerol---serine O-phosphatidyltransferase